MIKRKKLFIIIIGLFSTLSFNTVFAASERIIEEVIVTATKREESVQDVPIAVSAFGGEELARRGITEFDALAEISPSVAIQQSTNSGQGGSIRIRGVGTAGSNPGLEAAVGTFIDGVYRSRAGQAFSDLGDIERIEILRGPQGTLFGKNTVAGAVNVVTNKPQFEKNARIEVSAGNLDFINVKGFFNADANDELAFRFSYAWAERDGYVEDVNTDEVYSDKNRYILKGQALWAPSDELEVRVILDYSEKEEACCVAVFTEVGSREPVVSAIGGVQHIFEKDKDPQVGVNFPPFTDIKDKGISVEVSWDINDDISFKSLTAYREFDMHRGVDPDFSSADILSTLDTTNPFENFSQEFHLIGSTDDIDWFFGAYIYSEDMSSDEIVAFSTAGPAYVSLLFTGGASATALASLVSGNPAGREEVPGHTLNQGYDSDFKTKTEGWSLFTHNTWHASEALAFTLGLRYSHEEKTGSGIINGAAVGAPLIHDPMCSTAVAGPFGSFCNNPSFKQKVKENEWTGTAKVAYQLSENLHTYAGVSRGYKAGGFNLDQQAVALEGVTFDPETSLSYELGLKGTFLDGALIVNTAAFHTTFDDFQLNTFTGLGFFITNVKEVTSKGVELETLWAMSDSITLSMGVTYANARYGTDEPIPVDTLGTDISGRRLNLSPYWQSSTALFIEDTLPGTDWSYAFNVNWSFVGQVNTGSDLRPEKERGAFNKWNSQIALTSPEGKYTATVWGRNLGNTIRRNVVANTPLQTGSYSTFLTIGRTYGLTLSAYLE